MSRIGRKPIELPKGVSASVADGVIRIRGPRGELVQPMIDGVLAQQEGDQLIISRERETQQLRAFHGMVRALVANMVHGVSVGFERKLEIQGVGYKAEVKGKDFLLSLGYSHPITYAIPQGIKIDVDAKTNVIKVTGNDRCQVGQVASELRGFRPPDHYKGKGIRYMGERVRIKAGKSATK
jgi:large subunit ribosomal protein L6